MAPTTTKPVDRVLAKLEGVRQVGQDQWEARCPAHDDSTPSLSVGVGVGERALAYCHAGCALADVQAAAGLSDQDLFVNEPARTNGHDRPKITATYAYVDEAGELLYEVVRREPKSFRQRRPAPDGNGWEWKLGDTRRVLYNLPDVRQAVTEGRTVWIVEGEKDADSLARAGEVATCNPQGAGKWSKVADAAEQLAGADVIVWIDDDKAGRDHGRQVVASIDGRAARWTVVRSTAAKDAAEHLGAGRAPDELEVLAQSDGDRRWLDGDAKPEPDPEPPGDDEQHVSLELIDWATLHDRPLEIIEGFALPGRWTALVAPAKTGKSLLLIALTTAAASGRHPFTDDPMEPVTSLYVDAEMGRLDLAERLEDLGVNPAELEHWHATDLPPRLDTPEGGAALAVAAQQLEAVIVVIDGINGTVTGAEKDDTTWRPFFDHTIAPLKRLGIAVLTGDNLGKDKTLGPRGSSVKVDKPDAVLSMSRTDDGLRLTATHRRSAAYPETRTLRVEGVNDTSPVRYRETTNAWPAGTKAAAHILDRLGVPLDHGRDKARRALIEAGEKVGNDALAGALRWRKTNTPRSTP